jgi:hypothetical protein
MDDSLIQIDAHQVHDISKISISLPRLILDSELNDSPEAATANSADIPKTIRNKFYSNIHTYDKNWSATRILCILYKYQRANRTELFRFEFGSVRLNF